MKKTVAEYLDAKRFCAPTGCWLWTGTKTIDGYGKVWDAAAKTYLLAHRAMFERTTGPIPAGMCVCHHCDVPACINPDHLYVGTHTDNMRDKMRRGRGNHLSGEIHPRSKLTAEIVRIIRRSEEPTATLARRYGVDWSTLADARIGKTWRTL